MRIFFFNDTATTEIYTLSLHDALPILERLSDLLLGGKRTRGVGGELFDRREGGLAWLLALEQDGLAGLALPGSCQLGDLRSEEHTSELQSRQYLVCRLLLEKTQPSWQR